MTIIDEQGDYPPDHDPTHVTETAAMWPAVRKDEAALLRRNQIDTSRVLITDYERMGPNVHYRQLLVDDAGEVLYYATGHSASRVIDVTLTVYP